jgi:hypothetical protein
MSDLWWLPVLTFVGGSGVTLGVEYLRTIVAREDRRQDAAERAADRQAVAAERAADRRAVAADRRQRREAHLRDSLRAERREAMLELQEQLSDFGRKVGAANHADLMAWRAAGEPEHYPVAQLPDGLSEDLNRLQRRILVLKERIDDEQLRTLVSRFLELALAEGRSRVEAERQMREAMSRFAAVNSRIGALLRSSPLTELEPPPSEVGTIT